jgi:hypothetical protein
LSLIIPNGPEALVSLSGQWRFISGGLPPAPPLTPAPTARINRFESDVTMYQAGGTVLLSWEMVGAQAALVEITDEQLGSLVGLYEALPTNGSLPVVVPANLVNGVRFTLWGINGDSSNLSSVQRLVSAAITLPLNAADPLPLAPTAAPTAISLAQPAPVTVQAAYQPFERGFMIWVGSSGVVYVFLPMDSRVMVYEQQLYELLPDNPVTNVPPSGYFSPVSGFARVWGNDDTVRAMLGWAVAPEQGYTANFTASDDGIVINLPDGRMVTTSRGAWRYAP